MSDRVQGLVDSAIGRVPDHPGDIEVVRARARQRQRRQRGAGIAVALVLLAGVAIGLGGDRIPDIPVIGSDATETVVHLRWCAPTSLCGDPEVTAEEAVALLEADPAVADVRLIPADEVRDILGRELMRQDGFDDVPDDVFPPVIEVRLDTQEPLLDVVRRFHDLAPGVAVSPNALEVTAARTAGGDRYRGFDPGAATAGRRTIATAGDTHLDVWPVEDGGVCYEVGGLVSCHDNSLVVDGVNREQGAWGRLEDDGVCAWGTTGYRVDEVTVTFDDGTQASAVLGSVPETLLGQTFLVCRDAETYPVQIEVRAPRSEGAIGASEGQSILDEVVRDDPEALGRLLEHLHERLDAGTIQASFAGGSSAELRAAAATMGADIEAAGVPQGFDDLRVVDVGVDTPDDRRTYVYAVVEATGATDPPRCLDVRLDVEGSDDGLWMSERTWSRGACPTP